MEKELILIYTYLAITNIVAFLTYWSDKGRAQHGQRRIPEDTLIGMAIIGGSVGSIAAMLIFRHKTRHRKFKYGIPIVLIIQLALAGYLYYILTIG